MTSVLPPLRPPTCAVADRFRPRTPSPITVFDTLTLLSTEAVCPLCGSQLGGEELKEAQTTLSTTLRALLTKEQLKQTTSPRGLLARRALWSRRGQNMGAVNYLRFEKGRSLCQGECSVCCKPVAKHQLARFLSAADRSILRARQQSNNERPRTKSVLPRRTGSLEKPALKRRRSR